MSDRVLNLKLSLKELESEKKRLESEIVEIKQTIFNELAKLNDESCTDEDGETIRIVRPVRKTYDWATIEKRVGLLKFKKITKQIPDEIKLTEAISSGIIDMKTIAGCVIETPTSPYVRTYKPRDEENTS